MGLLKSILTQPGRAKAAARPDAPHEAASAIAQIVAEEARLRHLVNGERRDLAAREAQIERLTDQRLKALTDLRLSESPQADAGAVERLGAQIESLKQQVEDSGHVLREAERRLAVLQEQKQQAKLNYQVCLGELLNHEYRALAAVYEQQATQLAETILQISAVIQTMYAYGAGDSNGFARKAYLPRIVPGDGRTHSPILDTSRNNELTSGGARYADAVISKIRAAGYNWNLKND